MNNLFLVIQREYLTRVKKKSFIVISLLVPFSMIIMMILPILLTSVGSQTTYNVAVADRTDQYIHALQSNDIVHYTPFPNDIDEDSIRHIYINCGYDAYLLINGTPNKKGNVKLCSSSSLTTDACTKIRNDIRNEYRQQLTDKLRNDFPEADSLIAHLNDKTDISNITISENGIDGESSPFITEFISIISMMLIYMTVLISGTMVMNSVMEEKTNKIIEILVSSVKPFDLMMGKIIGIALMTLTQIAIWAVVGTGIMICTSIIMPTPDASVTADMSQDVTSELAMEIISALRSIDIVGVLTLFVSYYIGGYLLYASLYACIGASADSNTDGQMLSMPINILIITSLYLAMYAVHDPHGPVTVFASIFPFSSPFVMIARLPFNVSLWQIYTSITVLILSFIATTWVSARIYRVGILMHGKKVTLKELWKWVKLAN
ncbi:MAG: ABC transporter permease [Bacteroidales bacterium]|nr:ABC transporter permease [Bacteroidales bacterium]